MVPALPVARVYEALLRPRPLVEAAPPPSHFLVINSIISGSSGAVRGVNTLTRVPFSSIRYFWKFHCTFESLTPWGFLSVSHLLSGWICLPLTEKIGRAHV